MQSKAMPELCDLQIHINDQQTFFVDEKKVLKYSGWLRKMIKQEKRKNQMKKSGFRIIDFPGGPYGFELVSRFCYNNGGIEISVSNVSLLHCCAVFLGMSEKYSRCNLLHQTETFLEGMFYWSWNDILVCLKSCEDFFEYADSSDLMHKLICSLMAKIAQNSDFSLVGASSSSSSSSPETKSANFRFSNSTKAATPESVNANPNSSSSSSSSSLSNPWWFQDLTILSPKIIEKFIKTLGAYGTENNSLILTKFLFHYLKSAAHSKSGSSVLKHPYSDGYSGLAETAIYGIMLVGKGEFSCRKLFWVLRLVSRFSISRECRDQLERLIGEMLEKATLDDLLVSGSHDGVGGVYDVHLVLRLVKVFVNTNEDMLLQSQKMRKVARLIDKYLIEISPDHNLKVSKFLRVAESLPDFARDSFDGVYRAIDIYLESHPSLSFEERSRLCRCLKYEMLSLEACKDLAKNPKIPPTIAVQALKCQPYSNNDVSKVDPFTEYESSNGKNCQIVAYNNDVASDKLAESEDMKLNIQRMQWRVVELEEVCKEMKDQMVKLVKKNKVIMSSPSMHSRSSLPRLC